MGGLFRGFAYQLGERVSFGILGHRNHVYDGPDRIHEESDAQAEKHDLDDAVLVFRVSSFLYRN
jgi:hypothetical protein